MMIALGEGDSNFNVLLIGLTYKDLDNLEAGRSIHQVMPDGSPVVRMMIIAGPTDEALKERVTSTAQAAGKEVVINATIDRDGKPV